MGQYVRWQAIIAIIGTILLLAYLRSIVVVTTTVVVPDKGGTYSEGVVGNVQSLNPLLAQFNPLDRDITNLIFDSLTEDDGQGNITPVLAKDWHVSDDGLVYEFSLRKDIKWADGASFTSDDVIFTLNYIQSPDFAGSALLNQIWQNISVEKIDDHTVQFVLNQPFPAFVYYTTFKILPEHILADVTPKDMLTHPFNLAPLGTGPFQLQQATDHHILLSQNPRYWGNRSKIERVEFIFYPTLSSLYQAFSNGEIDGISQNKPAADTPPLNEASWQSFSAIRPQYDIIYLNLQQPEGLPFFQDSAVRQALYMLIDKQAVIDNALNGQGVAASGPILPWSWAYNPAQEYPQYNPAQAVALLDTAGWIDTDNDGIRDNNGVPLAFSLLVSNNSSHIATAEQITEQWNTHGISATVEIITTGLSERLTNHQFESALIQLELINDPDLYPLWHQTQIEGGQNFAGWDNTPASQALEQGRLALSQDERLPHYYQFQEIFAQEMPAFILHYPVYTLFLNDRVKNVQLTTITTPADRFKTISDWYLLTERVIESTLNEQFSTP